MRILYVSHSFPLPDRPLSNVGGMQRVAVGLHRALAAHPEVELDQVVLETSWRWTGLRTPAFLVHLLRTLPARVRAHRADVVLFSSMVTASVTPLLRRRIGEAGAVTAVIPVGRDVTLPNPVYQQLVPKVFSGVDLVFPISRATGAACVEHGARPEQVHVVPCGVDLPPSPTLQQRREAREGVMAHLACLGGSLPEDPLLLLSVGRHQERKGFHWFVEHALPRSPSKAVYLLAGSGPMTAKIREGIAAAGLGSRAILLGQVSEELLGKLYLGCDLFIMPNVPVAGDIEGFGVVMLEAGAAGLPVIAADLEGIRDVITPGENGELLPSGDAEAFAAAITRYEDPDLHANAAARAAAHVQSTFGWGAVADRYLELLRAAGVGSSK